MVLGAVELTRQALARGLEAFADDAQQPSRIMATAERLGLGGQKSVVGTFVGGSRLALIGGPYFLGIPPGISLPYLGMHQGKPFDQQAASTKFSLGLLGG